MAWLPTTNDSTDIRLSYKVAWQHNKTHLRTPLADHAKNILDYILSKGGALEISQRLLAKELEIPWRSYIEALKLIPNLDISTLGKGRNAKSILKIEQDKKLKLVQ